MSEVLVLTPEQYDAAERGEVLQVVTADDAFDGATDVWPAGDDCAPGSHWIKVGVGATLRSPPHTPGEVYAAPKREPGDDEPVKHRRFRMGGREYVQLLERLKIRGLWLRCEKVGVKSWHDLFEDVELGIKLGFRSSATDGCDAVDDYRDFLEELMQGAQNVWVSHFVKGEKT